jgi:hypothetical protein
MVSCSCMYVADEEFPSTSLLRTEVSTILVDTKFNLEVNTLPREHRRCVLNGGRGVAYNVGGNLNSLTPPKNVCMF